MRPSLAKFKDVGSLAKSYLELEKTRGTGIVVPKSDAPDAEWNSFYEKTGRPATVADYKVDRPKLEGLGEYPEEMQKSFLDVAHKNGLTSRQAQAALNWWGERQGAMLKDLQTQTTAAVNALHKDWGAQYEPNLAAARGAGKVLLEGHDDLVQLLQTTGMDRNPAVVKFFHKMSTMIGETAVIDPKASTPETSDVSKATEELAASRAEYDALSPALRTLRSKEYGAKWAGMYARMGLVANGVTNS